MNREEKQLRCKKQYPRGLVGNFWSQLFLYFWVYFWDPYLVTSIILYHAALIWGFLSLLVCAHACVYAVGPKWEVKLEARLLRGRLRGLYLSRPLAEKVSRASGNDEGGKKNTRSVPIGEHRNAAGPCFCFLAWISDQSDWCPCSCVSSPHLTAQPNPPKIHEGWWAYKEVVQGSFVPGKPRNSMQHIWYIEVSHRILISLHTHTSWSLLHI